MITTDERPLSTKEEMKSYLIRVKRIEDIQVGYYNKVEDGFRALYKGIPYQAPLLVYQDGQGEERTWILRVPEDYSFAIAEIESCLTCHHPQITTVHYIPTSSAQADLPEEECQWHYCIFCGKKPASHKFVCDWHRGLDLATAQYCAGCNKPLGNSLLKVRSIFCVSCEEALSR